MILIVLLDKTPSVSFETDLKRVVPLLWSVSILYLNTECLISVHNIFLIMFSFSSQCEVPPEDCKRSLSYYLSTMCW